MESEEFVGMADHHSGLPNAAIEKASQKLMSPIPEVGVCFRATTPKRP